MSYTKTDQLNAKIYSQQRYTLALVNKVAEKYKHIGTHLDVRIRAATTADYYFPLNFANRAIMVDVKINESLCKRLSCNSETMTGPCTKDMLPHYHRVGDTVGENERFEMVCQSSCFNLFKEPVYDSDNKPMLQFRRLNYNRRTNQCVFVSAAATWAEVPLYRSKERYETRVNDLPVGFNYEYNDFTQDGLGYEINKTYCESFFDTWLPEKKECSSMANVWDFTTNAIIGETLIKMVKGGVTAVVNNGNTIPNPNLPPPPPVEDKYLLQNWLNDINEDFITYNPDDDLDVILQQQSDYLIKKFRKNLSNYDSMKTDNINFGASFETFYDSSIPSQWEVLVETLNTLKTKQVLNQHNISNQKRRDLESSINNYNKNLYGRLHFVEKTHLNNKITNIESNDELQDLVNSIILNKKNTKKRNKRSTKNWDPSKDPVYIASIKLSKIVISMLESLFTDPMFIATMGIDVLFDKLLSVIKNQSTQILKTLVPRLSMLAVRLGRPIGLNVFNMSLKLTLSRAIAQITVKIAGAVIRAMARIALLAASVIGVVLIITSLLDLAFSIWDPLGFHKKFPREQLQQIMIQSGMAFRQELETSSLELTFNALASQILLSKDEITELSLNTFTWTLEYLEALEVNSEGSRIDKGILIAFNVTSNELESQLNIETAQLNIYTPDDFINYEQMFMNRVRLTGVLQIIGITTCTVGIILIALQLHMLALLIILIGLFILMVSKLNMDFDFLVANIDQNTLNQIFLLFNK